MTHWIILAAALIAGDAGAYEVRRDLVYASPDGTDLRLDAYLPKRTEPSPAVLVVHGGSWKNGNKSQLAGYAMRLAARGFVALAINYRLAPEHKHPAQIEDCRSALQWAVENAKDLRIDPARIGGIGYSAGAHLVFLLGMAGDQNSPKVSKSDPSRPRLKAVVAGGSPCNFTVIDDDDPVIAHFLGGTKRQLPQAYIDASPHFYLSPDDPPIFFFHGTNDRLVTIKGPEIMVRELKEIGVPAELFRVENGDHITTAMNREAIEQAVQFLDRHLKPTSTKE